MANGNALSRTQRKLEKLELAHLRQHCADLQARLEQAEQNVVWAQESAEFWQQHATQLQEAFHDENFATHRAIGLTKSGETLVVALS